MAKEELRRPTGRPEHNRDDCILASVNERPTAPAVL